MILEIIITEKENEMKTQKVLGEEEIQLSKIPIYMIRKTLAQMVEEIIQRYFDDHK